jgi:hypothetical protein
VAADTAAPLEEHPASFNHFAVRFILPDRLSRRRGDVRDIFFFTNPLQRRVDAIEGSLNALLRRLDERQARAEQRCDELERQVEALREQRRL